MKVLISLLALSGLAGCGVKGSAVVGELDEADQEALCEETIAAYGTEETDCGDGITVSAGTQEECVEGMSAYADCDLLVSEWRDCVDAVAADPCNGFGDTACAPVLACLL